MPSVDTVVDTTEGTVVVRNGTSGRWEDSQAWTLREDFRIGDAIRGDPEEQFSSGTIGLALSPNGQIFALSYSADRISVFSGDGTFVRSFGRTGRGPGEFLGPRAMGWDAEDRLWVADRGNRRYNVFDSAGTFIKTVPRPISIANRPQHLLFPHGPNAFIDEGAKRGGIALFLKVDTTGQVVDTVASLRKPEIPDSFRGLFLRPSQQDLRFVMRNYVPRLRWSLAPSRTIWSAETGELRLIHRTFTGDTLRIVETTHRDSGLSSQDESRIEAGLAEAGLARQDVELTRPILDRIYVLDDGHVLVGIVDEVGSAAQMFDVFDPEGIFLGTIDFGFRVPRLSIPALVGDTFVVAGHGRYGVPFVARFTIERPAGRRSASGPRTSAASAPR